MKLYEYFVKFINGNLSQKIHLKKQFENFLLMMTK